jgi:sugar lactone lactonase YvrE
MVRLYTPLAAVVLLSVNAGAEAEPPLLSPPYEWSLSAPLIAPAERPGDPCHSIKDPTVVFHDGKWHLFATIRSQKRTHQIEYLAFTDWARANDAKRHVLTLTDGYFCAPQVFYFTPHKKWYLIYQVSDPTRTPALQPAFSTTTDLADPASWSKPKLLFDRNPDGVKAWIDFWVICDDTHARLFFTSLDGRMWRSDAKLADFPHGWGKPAVVLTADIFEASHTYKLKESGTFVTIVEAQAGDRRYYKAYSAAKLDGEWKPLADKWDAPFAGRTNLRRKEKDRVLWTDNVSHGELLRAGFDEKLEVDPNNVRLLFQGVSDADRKGKKYGDIPWKLGVLELGPVRADEKRPAKFPDYRPVAGWPQLPPKVELGPVSAVATDSADRVYVFHRGPKPVLVFDRDGKFLRSWGDEHIKTAHGLRIDAGGNVWVTDIGNHQVMKFDTEGKLLLALGKKGEAGDAPDRFDRPTDVAVAAGGEFYVTDGYGNARVMKFDRDGKLLKQWGKKGTAEGEFNLPHAVCLDAKGRVYVGDRENNRIQVFDADGRFLAQWKESGAPYGLFRAGDRWFVADGRAHWVRVLDADGKPLARWGEKGTAAGQFLLPHMLCVDSKGSVYVAEVTGKRIQKFTPE